MGVSDVVGEGGEWKMGLVIPCIGTVGLDMEGEAAHIALAAVKGGGSGRAMGV